MPYCTLCQVVPPWGRVDLSALLSGYGNPENRPNPGVVLNRGNAPLYV